MDESLSLPIDTEWLRAHAPQGTEWGSGGLARIPFLPRRGWGTWFLVVWRLRDGERVVDLKVIADSPHLTGPTGPRTSIVQYGRVKTRAELIQVYNRFCDVDWPS
jgi:hypothetical protein